MVSGQTAQIVRSGREGDGKEIPGDCAIQLLWLRDVMYARDASEQWRKWQGGKWQPGAPELPRCEVSGWLADTIRDGRHYRGDLGDRHLPQVPIVGCVIDGCECPAAPGSRYCRHHEQWGRQHDQAA
jgi:hypothetical protein